MKPIALALAAGLLGTGCIFVDDEECETVVTLEWSFQDWDGAVRGCTSPQRQPVDFVDVWVDGNFVTSFSCFDGRGSFAISSRSRLVTVEGISGGTIAYRHEFETARTCADQLVLVRPAQGTVLIDYAFENNACHSPPTFVALSVRDDITGQNAILETAATGPACSTTAAAPEYTLPVGQFTLEWIEEVTGAGGVLAADCTDRPFFVDPSARTTLQPLLVDTTAVCL